MKVCTAISGHCGGSCGGARLCTNLRPWVHYLVDPALPPTPADLRRVCDPCGAARQSITAAIAAR